MALKKDSKLLEDVAQQEDAAALNTINLAKKIIGPPSISDTSVKN